MRATQACAQAQAMDCRCGPRAAPAAGRRRFARQFDEAIADRRIDRQAVVPDRCRSIARASQPAYPGLLRCRRAKGTSPAASFEHGARRSSTAVWLAASDRCARRTAQRAQPPLAHHARRAVVSVRRRARRQRRPDLVEHWRISVGPVALFRSARCERSTRARPRSSSLSREP